MSREFPDFIDPWRAADGERRIGGTIPLARLKRLTPLLESVDGVAKFDLQFGYDAQRRAVVDVDVSAPLTLTCQRSLEPYVEEARQQSTLLVIADMAEQALLSSDEEYVLVPEGRLAVADLVEDELLLAVPQVPKNPNVDTVWSSTTEEADKDGKGSRRSSGVQGDAGENRQRPFEALAELIKKETK